MRPWAALFALCLLRAASACSTRPGSLLIFYTGATTLVCAALSAILTMFAFSRGLPHAKRACLFLLVIHPAWTMMGFCCDCGATQSTAAVLDVVLSASALFWDAARRRQR